MRFGALRGHPACLFATALLLPSPAQAEARAGIATAQLIAQAAGPAATSDFQRKAALYARARAAYEEQAKAYWTSISEKRRARNEKRRNKQEIVLDDYVLTHPPVYTGPPRPPGYTEPPGEPRPRRPPIPVVADFLRSAAEHFKFAPQRPRSEIEFKRAYAAVAAAAGITRDQAVRIYGFEAGGNGHYDVQAGLEHHRPGARAISTALGYNQLLTTNTVSILAEHGDRIIVTLLAKAATAGSPERESLERKVDVLKRMVAFSRTVPQRWGEQEKLAATPQGYGLHALNLDIDVGPLLQTQKLLDSIVFARRRGYDRPLSAAELEMMNLTGDGNGFDMVSMPLAMREQVPTSNFFLQGGYQRNPIASRNNVVAKLIAATDARMDREVGKQGARDLAAAFDR
jgi:hypothetical protein